MKILQQISLKLQEGNASQVANLVQEALNAGIPVDRILIEGLISGMDIISSKFKKNEIYIPEVLIAARAMHAGMEILKSVLKNSEIKPLGKIIIGTVKGDLHDIGKNLVKMFMEGAGFEVIDLGVDVSMERFIEAVDRYKPDILAMSALLTTTMPEMKKVISGLGKAGLKAKLPTMIGGAPVTVRYAEEIGANAYAKDAAEAVEKAKELLKLGD